MLLGTGQMWKCLRKQRISLLAAGGKRKSLIEGVGEEEELSFGLLLIPTTFKRKAGLHDFQLIGSHSPEFARKRSTYTEMDSSSVICHLTSFCHLTSWHRESGLSL